MSWLVSRVCVVYSIDDLIPFVRRRVAPHPRAPVVGNSALSGRFRQLGAELRASRTSSGPPRSVLVNPPLGEFLVDGSICRNLRDA